MKKSIWRTILGGLSFGGVLKKNGFELYRSNPDHFGIVYKYEDGGPYFYFKKKHYCEKCGELLEKREESTFEEEYDYGMVETSIIGPAKIIRYFFYCKQCEKNFTAKELKEAKHNRKKNLTLKD